MVREAFFSILGNAIPDRLFRITVDARGNPTVDWEAIKPIYREAMKKPTTAGNIQ